MGKGSLQGQFDKQWHFEGSTQIERRYSTNKKRWGGPRGATTGLKKGFKTKDQKLIAPAEDTGERQYNRGPATDEIQHKTKNQLTHASNPMHCQKKQQRSHVGQLLVGTL